MSKIHTTIKSHLTAPPMGWNSWDCYGASVTEEEVLANARIVRNKLLPFGWNTIVVDIQWSEPAAKGWYYNAFAPLTLDEYGRQLPAVNRFPSAADGKGFTQLGNKIHDLGLMFGVHLMRGIPREAVARNLPVKGTEYTARDIADTRSICAWNTDMYGVNPEHEGAQGYYNSVFELFAEWGVDYVKVDDIAWNFMEDNHYPAREAELIHRAIRNSGRRMTLSLSPGPADPRHRAHYHHFANAWRITDDFWDQWPLVERCLDACVSWAGDSGNGSWPDADMLPFGRILMRMQGDDGKPGKPSQFTPEEEQLVFSMWCLMRSPLMLGADLPASPPELIDRLTQAAYLEWSQVGSPSRLLSEPAAKLMVWTQESPLPAEPAMIGGRTAGPAYEGSRYPLLLVNRGEEPIHVSLHDLLAGYPLTDGKPVSEWYEIEEGQPGTWRSGPWPELTVEPHASRGFVLGISDL